jgi:hypothetical protein
VVGNLSFVFYLLFLPFPRSQDGGIVSTHVLYNMYFLFPIKRHHLEGKNLTTMSGVISCAFSLSGRIPHNPYHSTSPQIHRILTTIINFVHLPHYDQLAYLLSTTLLRVLVLAYPVSICARVLVGSLLLYSLLLCLVIVDKTGF